MHVFRHFILLVWLITTSAHATEPSLAQQFRTPPDATRPWVLWHWVNAAVSREGIAADLIAMRDAGIGGAYLLSIHGPTNPPLIEPPAIPGTDHWWQLVKFATEEAQRLGLKLGMNVCDGFATAGGPWITPELSMQEVTWSTTLVEAGASETILPQPPTRENYYRDLAVFAFPAPTEGVRASATEPVKVTTSDGAGATTLVRPGNTERYRSESPCWIEYEFATLFTARSVMIAPDGASSQCQRLTIEASDDGAGWRKVAQLSPPRHGWQDEARPVTHALPATTARKFRFHWTPVGTEPGSEDLDAAKWAPVLKVNEIRLSNLPRIHQFEGKCGAVWRVGEITQPEVGEGNVVRAAEVLDVSAKLQTGGKLDWKAPTGKWLVLRMGHTSTGKRNATGGAPGLECDKLSAAAVELQYNNWFGEAVRRVGPKLAPQTLCRLFIDSWECGSQNWSPRFAEEFSARRGYELRPYLPLFAGVPINSVQESERVLSDVRRTIAELVDEQFYATLAAKSRAGGFEFTGECTAPTMVGDGLRHFARLDQPMGEFWLGSPTHDKPNDILDAISAGHIYGKRVIGAEAFTQLRMEWNETPAMLKPLADRHFALGVNHLTLHVMPHNPDPDRRPGITLGAIGAHFGREQTWLPLARGFTTYLARCQYLLQQGRPVVDLAVLTTEDIPSRAWRPEQLLDAAPELIETPEREHMRRTNEGQPTTTSPRGVKHAANMTDAGDWLDPLQGYKYDSLSPHALRQGAVVQDGKIRLASGAEYRLLVVPQPCPTAPRANAVSAETAEQLKTLLLNGGRVWLADGLTPLDPRNALPNFTPKEEPLTQADFGVDPDFLAKEQGAPATGIAWTHRTTPEAEIYFVANQRNSGRQFAIALREECELAELWDPTTGAITAAPPREEGGSIPLSLPPYGSMFIVLPHEGVRTICSTAKETRTYLDNNSSDPFLWRVRFESSGGPSPAPRQLAELTDLTPLDAETAKFAGIVEYSTTFHLAAGNRAEWLELGAVTGPARVMVNHQDCGVAWTPPFRVRIAEAVKPGDNVLQVFVGGTWRNRLRAEAKLPEAQRTTWMTAPYEFASETPDPMGLLGPVRLFHSPGGATE